MTTRTKPLHPPAPLSHDPGNASDLPPEPPVTPSVYQAVSPRRAQPDKTELPPGLCLPRETPFLICTDRIAKRAGSEIGAHLTSAYPPVIRSQAELARMRSHLREPPSPTDSQESGISSEEPEPARQVTTESLYNSFLLAWEPCSG